MTNKRLFGATLEQMRANLDTITRDGFYFNFLLSADEMMFEWDGLPDTIDAKHLEDYLNISGCVGFARGTDIQTGKTGLYIAPYAARSGREDQYGEGTELQATTPNGIELRGVLGVDACIMYNNTARSAQTDLIFTTDTYTQIDKSSVANVIFSRIAPIFKTDNDKTTTQFEDIREALISGELGIITDKNIFSDDTLDIKTSDGLQCVDITHPERIQYLQYLSEYFDVVTRRHFARRGLTLKTSAKHAQVSQDEVHGLDSVSWFYPLNKLKARRDAVDIINGIFGTKISVRFSDIWEQEYQAYLLRILKTDTENEKGVENDVESVDNGSRDMGTETNTDSASAV